MTDPDMHTKPHHPTYEEMSQYITSLGPDSELYSGRKFFAALLKKRGLAGVIEFIERASNALAVGDDLDPYYDFNSVERELLANTPVKKWSRRAVLSLIPGAYFAGVEGVNSGLKVAAQISEAVTQKPNEAFNHAHEWIEKHLQPSANLAIAIVVGDEMYELVRSWKLEQVADALGELRQQVGFKTKNKQEEQVFRSTVEDLGAAVEKLRLQLEEHKKLHHPEGPGR